MDDTPFDTVIARAEQLDFTRDPFDRIIAGHALAANATLLTADGRIRAALPGVATWE